MHVPKNDFFAEQLGRQPGSDQINRVHMHKNSLRISGKLKNQSEQSQTLAEPAMAFFLAKRINFDIGRQSWSVALFLADNIEFIEAGREFRNPAKHKTGQEILPINFSGDKH